MWSSAPRASALLLALSFGFVACSPKFESGVTRCAGDRACPEGLVCHLADDTCYAPDRLPRDGGAGDGAREGGGLDADGGAGEVAAELPVRADATGPDRAPPPADCAAFARAWCAKKTACEPLADPSFPSEDACRPALEQYCTINFLDQPDSGWTPLAAGVCVAELERPDCFPWFGLSASRLCDPRGKRPGGAGVFSWVSCESAASYAGPGSCGYCFNSAAAGQPCGNDAVCPPAHLCSRAARCRPASLNGQPCGDDSPCHPAFVCVSSVCRARGIADARCKVDDDCDPSLGLRCNTGLGRCGKVVVGNSWNQGNPTGTVNTCGAGSLPQSTGTCLPLSAAGGPCSFATGDGPQCQLPFVCTAGMCVVPKAIDCPVVRPSEAYPPGADPWCNFDPARPQYCPARGDLPVGCWPAATACATITRCGKEPRFCPSATEVFDCTLGKCIDNPCKTAELPTYCPAFGDTQARCWPSGVRCSTVINCNGRQFACSSEQSTPDCTVDKCVPICAPPMTDNPCNQCAAKKCCGTYAACQGDPMCRNSTGPTWTALEACTTTNCTPTCTATPLAPPRAR